jgi:hypothetical protein
MKTRIVLRAGAVLLVLASALIAPEAAHASTGGPGITCSGGSCMIQLEHEVHWGGDYSLGSDNAGISVTPPCYWTPLGNAHDGSVTIVASLADSMEGFGATLSAELMRIYQQAYKMQNENPMPPGEWYMQLSTAPKYDQICENPPFDFVTPGPGGAIGPPPVALTPHDLAMLAIAVMKIPGAGVITTSPKGGTTYSNLPTFVEVRLAGQFHPRNESSRPYAEVTAQLGGAGATAWASATNVTLAVNGSRYNLAEKGCTYLGSQEMISDPSAVAGMGVGGQPDCGVTFLAPQQARITATVYWKVCYVEQPEALYVPPVGGCVQFTTLGPTTWPKGFNVEEIQAGNG